MKRSMKKTVGSLLLLCMMVMMTACGKDNKNSSVAFTQVKTAGVVKVVSPDKITMVVSVDDANFKKDEEVVVTFKNIYLNHSQSKSDVLTKTDDLSTGDTVYIIYGENQKKGNVINVNDLVKTENK